MDQPDIPWCEPAFVETSLADYGEDLNSTTNCWLYRKEFKCGVQICAFLLLSEFDGGKEISNYVAETFLSQLLDDERFSAILEEIKKQKNFSKFNANETGAENSIGQEIQKLLKDIFTRVDLDCRDFVTRSRLPDTITENFSSGGCSAILALILDDRLYMANCGNSVAIFGKKIGDEMTAFPLSKTHEIFDYFLPPYLHSFLTTDFSAQEVLSEQTITEFYHYLLCQPQNCFGDYGRKSHSASSMVLSTMEAPPTKKWLGSVDSTSEPFVLSQHIELSESTRFLLLISPITAKVLRVLNPESNAYPNAILASLLIQALEKHANRSVADAMNYVLKELAKKFHEKFGSILSNFTKFQANQQLPTLAMAYLNLEYRAPPILLECSSFSSSSLLPNNLNESVNGLNDYENSPLIKNISAEHLVSNYLEEGPSYGPRANAKPPICPPLAIVEAQMNHFMDIYDSDDETEPFDHSHKLKPDNYENEEEICGELEPVPSVVDWSEFYTHELHDTVLAKIESLKQLYQDRRKLATVKEKS